MQGDEVPRLVNPVEPCDTTEPQWRRS